MTADGQTELRPTAPDASLRALIEGRHPAFRAPEDPDAAVWRYLDFAKFVWLLDQRRLSMPHCRLMEDPFEGSTPLAQLERMEAAAAAAPASERAAAKRRIERLRALARDFRRGYFVSGWHMNDVESEAMWKLFSASNNAVALRSTFARLRRALPPYVGVGVVRYIDYRTEPLPELDLFQWIMHKRKSFAHEREVRAVASLHTPDERGGAEIRANADAAGYYPEIDVPALVESVHVHPLAEPWFVDLVRRLVARFGFEIPVHRSELAEKPLL